MDRNKADLLKQSVVVVALRKESVDRNFRHRIFVLILRVALRKESVDRNSICPTRLRPTGASLSARRAWIEIRYSRYCRYWVGSLSARRAWIEIRACTMTTTICTVALRKESVDRNCGPQGSGKTLSSRSPQGERG